MNRRSIFLALLPACAAVLAGREAAANEATEPVAGMGIMVGEVTPESALVQVRLTQTDRLVDGDVPGVAGVVTFFLWKAEALKSPKPRQPVAPTAEPSDNRTGSKNESEEEEWETIGHGTLLVKATAKRDFIARADFKELSPGTEYVCETEIGRNLASMRKGPTARFRTLPGPEASAPVKFVVVTGMNYAKFHGDDRIDRKQHLLQNNTELPPAYTGRDKHLGYPALATILSLKPDFFVGTGDNVYYDTPTDPRAKTAPEMRGKWHEQFVQPRYRDLFAAVPTYWEIDDHDYRKDDCDNTGDYEPSPELGKRMMLEQLPYASADARDPKTYRTHRVSRDLQIWLTENRLHRSPNKMPDGAEKSIWGREQKEWLKRTLRESDATFKVLISPTPMIGPDDLRKTDNHTNIGGFRHEREEFFSWLRETGIAERNFYLVCGDRHWQYHSVDPSGIEEFSSGALVDENSRLGRKPGDPKSTDPEGLIKQPYYQDAASGGFLLVKVDPAEADQAATLTFVFHDEHGKVLYEHAKTGARD